MTDQTEHNRLKLACRRGMLELDIFLNRYLDQAYNTADAAEISVFQRLLDAEDPELFSWLTGQSRPDEQALAVMVDKIRACPV